MAMAIAPLCLVFGPIIIEEPNVVSKSYPKFWEDLKQLGFLVSEVEV
jgi:3-phosphoshikimate 1-carboxyvinyltransferase